MPSDITVFASIAATLVSSLASAALVGVGVHTYWRRTVRRPDVVGRLEQDRLARLEQAIDVMAVEVERIAEGQRFLTRLHAERAPVQEPHVLPHAPSTR